MHVILKCPIYESVRNNLIDEIRNVSIDFDGFSDTDNSWETKESFRLTLAPKINTDEYYMVEKVIIWSI